MSGLGVLMVLVMSRAGAPTVSGAQVGECPTNVLDVWRMKYGSVPQDVRSSAPGAEEIVLETPSLALHPGATSSTRVIIEQNTTPLFGYSLDVDVIPEPGAVGTVIAHVGLTNFYLSQNLIEASGTASLDPLFSVILDPGDDGVFISANTDDGSTVTATAGVNDVLAEVYFSALPGSQGTFRIELGPASALSDGEGVPVAFGFVAGSIDVTSPVGVEAGVEVVSWGMVKNAYR